MAGLPPPPFFYRSPSDSPLDVYSPPQALQGGGREEHHHRSSSTPLSPCLAFFLVPSHRSKRFNSKQQDSAPLSFFPRLTHPLKPGYNRQTPQQRPFCSAAVGDAGSVLHQGGSGPQAEKGSSMHDAPLREHPTDHPAFSTKEPNTPPGLNDRHAPRPPGCSPHPAPSQNETPRGSMPLLARPFLVPSSTLHPLTPYYATTSPEDTSPLTLATPPPSEEREDPRRVLRTPLRANSDPSLFSQPSRTGSAYDDHPDCAVFPVVRPPGANPTNASSPRPAPSRGLRAERERDRGYPRTRP